MFQKPKNLITSPTLQGQSHLKETAANERRTMTDYEKVKDFLEWVDREIPKEKDKELKQAMLTVKKKIENKLKEKEDKTE